MNEVDFYDFSQKIEARKAVEKGYVFPIDLLPKWIQGLAAECEKSYGTPAELFALSFLCGVSAASGRKFSLKTGNYVNYPQLWLKIVGKSGSGKSEPFRLAMKPLLDSDKKKYDAYRAELGRAKLDELAEKPIWDQSLINDSTPEALFKVLGQSRDGLTLYRDELSGWFSDIGRYNRSGEIAHYLSIFDNSDFSINRKQDDPQLISAPFLNVFGTIQPKILSKVLSANNAEDSGFAQRFLFFYPKFPKREYGSVKEKPGFGKYNKLISDLLLMAKEEFRLSPEGEESYVLFFNEMEDLRYSADDFWASVFSKAQIQVLRLALTIRIARLTEKYDTIVEKKDMECACRLQRVFIGHLTEFKNENHSETKIGRSDLIRAVLKETDLSQSDVASLFGVTRQYVSKLVNLAPS